MAVDAASAITLRSRFAGFSAQEKEKNDLIDVSPNLSFQSKDISKGIQAFGNIHHLMWNQNILKTVEAYESQIRYLQLEVDHEKNSRVTFQEKVEKLSRQKLGLESMMVGMVDGEKRSMNVNMLKTQHAFVVVLVDGDGAIFLDELLESPKEGANEASRRIIQAVKESLQDDLLEQEDITILVRIFANLNDLGKTLHLTNVISHRSDLVTFAEHFTTSRGEFDFINVGPGKENADSKMRSKERSIRSA